MFAVSAIISIVRMVFFALDHIIYYWSAKIYSAALSLYDINSVLDTVPIIKRTMTVCYSFLAIVMFFKLAVSLIQMLIDPSLIEDKQKGASKLALNVVITLVLIVAIPMAFKVSREIQAKVIDEEVIEKAIYGETNNIDIGTVGDRLALSAWSTFLYPSGDTVAERKKNSVYKIWNDFFNVSETRTKDFTWNAGELFTSLNDTEILTLTNYKFTYWWLISTICGLYLCWTMITLALDIAYRSLKMLLLEIISPVAIMTYLDPKSSKDGIFAKWTEETISTYISLFIRIAIYALVSVIIMEFNNSTIIQANIITKIVYLLAVVALLKSGPKLIDKIFGTEISKDSENKVMKELTRGVFGAGVVGTAGAITGGVAAAKTGQSIFKGITSGGWKGMQSGYKSGTKGDLRGIVTGGIDTYKGVRKNYGYDAVDLYHERDVARMENVFAQAKAKKDARNNALQANNNALLTTLIDDHKMNIKGNKLDLSNVDESYKNAKIKGAFIKKEGTITMNENEGLKNTTVYNDKANMDLNESIVKEIHAQASAELDNRLAKDVSEQQMIMDIYMKNEGFADASAANLQIKFGTTDILSAYKKMVIDDVTKKSGGLTLDELANMVTLAESETKKAEKTIEDYGKTADGISDNKRRSLIDEADRKHNKF